MYLLVSLGSSVTVRGRKCGLPETRLQASSSAEPASGVGEESACLSSDIVQVFVMLVSEFGDCSVSKGTQLKQSFFCFVF